MPGLVQPAEPSLVLSPEFVGSLALQDGLSAVKVLGDESCRTVVCVGFCSAEPLIPLADETPATLDEQDCFLISPVQKDGNEL